MRHIMGNSPKCNECRYWKDPEPWEKCPEDGWCTNKKALSIGINGKKRQDPPEKEPVKWNQNCSWWEDAEYPYINNFEAETRKPDPNRGPMEQMIIADAIERAVEEQKDLDAYYRRKRGEEDNNAND